MERTLIHIIILGSIFGLTKGAGVLPNGLNAAVGGNVMFTTTVAPTPTPFASIIWQFKGGIVVISNSDDPKPSGGYKDRVTLDISTGSLELKKVSVNDSGIYTVAIVPKTGEPVSGQTTLTVQVPISNVEITPSSTHLNESSSVRLSCSSSGSSPSFRWFNVSSEVTADDRVQITDGGSVMTIVSVSRYDQGPFKCVVSNLVSTGTSAPVTFTINYGPYNVEISGTKQLKQGKDLELKCTAESVPLADYTWKRDGEIILLNSDKFTQENVKTSATYTCEAQNRVTGRSAFGNHYLTVTDPPLYIIGIVVGCLLAVGGSVGVAYACKNKRKKNKAEQPTAQA